MNELTEQIEKHLEKVASDNGYGSEAASTGDPDGLEGVWGHGYTFGQAQLLVGLVRAGLLPPNRLAEVVEQFKVTWADLR